MTREISDRMTDNAPHGVLRPDPDPKPLPGYACVLRWDALPDGRRVQTIDLFAAFTGQMFGVSIQQDAVRLSLRQHAVGLCNSLGRYETVVGDDYDRLYRARTWQEAWSIHEALLRVHAA